jgi:hypothetical protein
MSYFFLRVELTSFAVLVFLFAKSHFILGAQDILKKYRALELGEITLLKKKRKRQANFVVYCVIILREKASLFFVFNTWRFGDWALLFLHHKSRLFGPGKCTCMIGKKGKNIWRCIDKGVRRKEQVARSM